MSKPVIQVKGISKSYKISHEQRANVGDVTMRDAIVRTLRKPVELLTGHVMKKEKFWALHDVSFDVQPGEVVGIIGKNGSGKSTLLKIMSRITEPTHGEIVMNGRVASLLEVGTGFHSELTGRENIYFNGSILGMKKKEIDAKFDEIVAFSEVEKFLDTPVKFYSSGMYVRLAFAVAAHLDPDILIIDEVLAVGDLAFQKKCLGKMQSAASEGRTVLFVSHNMATVKSLCKQAIWLDKGVIKEAGPIQKVADKYESSGLNEAQKELKTRLRTTKISGEARLTDVKIFNGSSESTDFIDSSKPMTLVFVIDSKKDIKNVNLHARISYAAQPEISFNTEYTGKSFNINKGKNVFECEFVPTNLSGGTYSIDFSMIPDRDNVKLHIDELFDAKSFVVKDFEPKNNRQLLTQNIATYYVDHKWEKAE